MQELADKVHSFLNTLVKQLLSGQTGMPLTDRIPHLSRLSDSWAAYSRAEGQEAPASFVTADAGRQQYAVSGLSS